MATWMLFQQFPCSQHRIQNQHIAKQWYKSPHKFELLRILVRIIPFLACNSAAVFHRKNTPARRVPFHAVFAT